jgi:putative ABC transport system ATP-binding protein
MYFSVISTRAHDFSLEVSESEFLTILGSSGSGKTTLFNRIGGLYKPTGGKVILDGYELTKLSEIKLLKCRRKKFGLVFQAFNLITTFFALKNLETAIAPKNMLKN